MEQSAALTGVDRGVALGAFLAYLALVVAIGLRAARFSSGGMAEYFLAGRRLGRWVVALSAVVSGRSAWLLVGLTAHAWRHGASALWSAAGYVVVEFLLFWDYARRLRRFSETHDCITLPDFYAARFHDRGLLRLLLVAVFLVFLPTYVGAQFQAGSKTFTSAFGLAEGSSLLLTAGIVLLYTVLGGFLAVSLTDALQGVLMLVALVVLPLAAIADLGGWQALGDGLAALGPDATGHGLADPFGLPLLALVGALGIGLGSPGNPHIIVRYMAIDDPEQLRVSAVVATVWNAVMAAGAVLTGLAGRVFFPDAAALPGGDAEALYPTLAAQHLPPVVFGVVLAAIFAAIMSTTDSQLLVAASGVVRDIWEKLLRRGQALDGRRLVVASRVVVTLLVGVSVLLGMYGGEVVYWFVLLAWAGLGASLGPTSLLALYWRGTTCAGVVAGVLAGAATVFVWVAWFKEPSGLYELVPGFAAGLLATVAVSLLTRPPPDVEAMFAAMERPRDDG